MAGGAAGRRVVVAAVLMVLLAQGLAIVVDLILRQNDPSDIVMFGVLVLLSLLALRRAGWARWVIVVLAGAGGLLELVAAPLLVATRAGPAFWSGVDRAVPALRGLHAMVVAAAAGTGYPLLVGSLVMGALLDLTAAAALVFVPAVREFFRR